MKNAETISQEVNHLNRNATKLKEEAGLMADRVSNTEINFNELLDLVHNNNSLINEAKEKVGRATKDSQDATKKVEEIVAAIDDILSSLESTPKYDDDELKRLEEKLKEAEQQVKNADLNQILEQLQKEQRDQNLLYDQYNQEIEMLRREVKNIEEIANSLPDDCFRKPALEP